MLNYLIYLLSIFLSVLYIIKKGWEVKGNIL
jgi:hypothetical protein